MDPVAIAAAHVAAIPLLEAAGQSTHAETLRVHGTECLRLARLGQAQHQAQGRIVDPAKAETEPLVRKTDAVTRNARHHG
jgi:hypothetical protein